MSTPKAGRWQPMCPKKGKSLKRAWLRWLFPIAGLSALIWFLVRVIPKPTRAEYPCQRVAAPLASGFVVWVLGLAGSLVFIHKSRRLLRKSRYVIAGTCFAIAVSAIWWSAGITGKLADAGTFTPLDPPNSPMGVAKGINPGRVVWVYDPNATSWDGSSDYWYHDTNTNPEVVSEMVSRAIHGLTGQNDDANSWDALFRHFNDQHNKELTPYTAGEKIAIKLNLNRCRTHGDMGNDSFLAPQLVEALLKQLVNNAGVAASDITVYDASRQVPAPIYDRCSVGDLAGVQFADSVGGDGRILAQRDLNTIVYHANPDVPPRWLPDFVSEAEYVINFAILKGHFLPGVTLCAKNHFGSTWVAADANHSGSRGREGFWPGYNIHKYINAFDTTGGKPYSFIANSSFEIPERPPGSYSPLVELMGHEDLGAKTLLFLLDGLYPAMYQSAMLSDSPPWEMEPFDSDWTSSILVSQDGVAIDSVGLDFLRSEPTVIYVADDNDYSIADDYLHEAALADDPCSGTFYDPDNDGNVVRLDSVGVHEHWNNSIDKRYSRNLGTGDGIELIRVWNNVFYDMDGDEDVDLIDFAKFCQGWDKEFGWEQLRDFQKSWLGPDNLAPIADAGDDQSVIDTDDNGSQSVSLDGSGSYDTNGSIVSYTWKEDTTVLAYGETNDVILDVGSHTISLEVVDDNGAGDTDIVMIQVSEPGPMVGSTTWQSQSLSSGQSGVFTVEFDATPHQNDMDGVTGFSQNVPAGFTDMGCIARFNRNGLIDVRNGSSYSYSNSVSYSAGTSYHFVFDIDIPNHQYDVYVTPDGGSETTLASNFSFRTEQKSCTRLNFCVVYSGLASHPVDNITIP